MFPASSQEGGLVSWPVGYSLRPFTVMTVSFLFPYRNLYLIHFGVHIIYVSVFKTFPENRAVLEYILNNRLWALS